jgi:hypothetical protein
MTEETIPARALSAGESCALLRGAGRFGHVSLSVRALPMIVPVTFSVEDDAAVVVWGRALDRTSPQVGDVVAFQTEGRDSEGRWSVLVLGRAEAASVEGKVAVRIPAEFVDGQRF